MSWLRGILLATTALLLVMASVPSQEQGEQPPLQAVDSKEPAGTFVQLVDANGDPLPDLAQQRFGTMRLRHGGAVRALAFSADGKHLLSAGSDHSIRLWDPATGEEDLHLREEWVSAAAVGRGGQLIASGNGVGTIRLWWGKTEWQPERLGEGESGKIHAVALSPDETQLASASCDGRLRLWDLTQKGTRTCTGHAGNVYAVAFSPDGRGLASAGADKTICLWDTTTARLRHRLQVASAVRSLAFTPDGKILVAAGEEKRLLRFDVATGKELPAFEGHKGLLEAVACSADGKWIVSTGHDPALRVWAADTGKAIRQIPLQEGDVGALAISPDSKWVAAAGLNGCIRLWDPGTGEERQRPAGHPSGVLAAAYCPGGKVLASASRDGTVCLWDAATGKMLQAPTVHAAPVRFALWPDGTVSMAGSTRDGFRVWNIRTSKEIQRLALPSDDAVESLALSPDGRIVAVGFESSALRLYEVATGQALRSCQGHGQAVIRLAFSPDGGPLASASRDGTVRLWDASTGAALRRFDHAHAGTALTFSPDGKVLAWGDPDGIISLCETATGKEVRQFEGHAGVVLSLVFSPDGKTLASAGQDEPVRLWELRSGREVLALEGHAGGAQALAFSPDGKSLASGGSDSTVLIWDATGLLHPGKAPLAHLKSSELEALWMELASPAGPQAYRAVWSLAAAPQESIPFLKERLQSLMGGDARRIAQLIAELDDDNFGVRERATEELKRLVGQAEQALRQALARSPSPEVRHRIERILDKRTLAISSGEQRLRTLRVLDVLEKIGSAEARQILQSMVKESPEAEYRQEARASLERLGKKTR